jgi:hypothetical protein
MNLTRTGNGKACRVIANRACLHYCEAWIEHHRWMDWDAPRNFTKDG